MSTRDTDIHSTPRPVLIVLWAALACIVVVLGTWLFQQWRYQNDSIWSRGNLKNIALAMLNYAAIHGTFPPQALCGPDGTPALSWRVALLPFVEEGALYQQFQLDEPWDSPRNTLLLTRIPRIYQAERRSRTHPYSTFYQVFVGGGAAFDVCNGVPPDDFRDGRAGTILVIEAGNPVPWTKPEDLCYAQDLPLPALGGVFKRVFNFAAADATVPTFEKSEPEQLIRKWITRRGMEPFDENDRRIFHGQ